MMRLVLDPVGHWALVALVVLALLPLVAWGPARSKSTPRRRRTLAGLRLAVVLLLLIALLRPTLVYTQTKKQSSSLIVLIDWTRSMSVPDAYDGKTRWQFLQETVERGRPSLAEMADDFRVKVYGFDSQLEPIELGDEPFLLPEQPAGQQSAIGKALDDALAREAGGRIAGVVLLTDGAQRAYPPHDNPPQTAARRMADEGTPLHTLAFGQGRGIAQARDVALKDFSPVSETVFVKNQLTVLGSAEVLGFSNQEVPVELLFETLPGKMEVVARTRIRGGDDASRHGIELDYVPQTAGEFKITLRAVPQPGELVASNNELSTFITVLKGGLNVLYIEAEPRPEQKFIRRSLDGSPNIQVDFVGLSPLNTGRRPAGLAERFAPGKYDAYILGNVHASQFLGDGETIKNSKLLAALKLAVERGSGLMMLGGTYSFGPGGYGESPLADVLPVEIDRLERQDLGESARADLHLGTNVRIVPTDLGQRHFLTRLAEDGSKNDELWDKLPSLDGANRFSGLKTRGLVLADTGGPSPTPLLVAFDYGRGRVLAFAGDSTWRWWLAGGEAQHKRFWRQVVLWLSHKDQSDEGNVWVRLDPRRYAPGQRVDFAAGAIAADGQPIEDAQFKAEVVLPDASRRPLRVQRRAGELGGSFLEAQAPGDYTIVVQASRGTDPLGTAQARFIVAEQDLELDNSTADPELLAGLSSITGGESLPPEQFASLLERIKKRPLESDLSIQKKTEVWDTWPFFALFVALLSAEWALRKKWGLA